MKKIGIDSITVISFGLVLVSVFTAMKFAYQKEEFRENLNRLNTKYEEFAYNVHSPHLDFVLPKKLVEISGLAITDDGQYAWAVNDQKGIVYKLDLLNKKISEKKRFSSGGDYEGIELIGDSLVILQSNGTLFTSSISESTTTKSATMSFHRKCDAEGLGYEKSKGRLLVACKNKFPKNPDLRMIYGVKFPSLKREEKPAFSISIKDLIIFGLRNGVKYIETKDIKKFAPSAIAVNDRTKQVYVLSSRGNLLVVLEANGTIAQMIPLARNIYEQPEGIAFGPDEVLYISTEGKSRKAALFGMKKINKKATEAFDEL